MDKHARPGRKAPAPIFPLALLAAALAGPALAAPGSLDPAFGVNGKAQSPGLMTASGSINHAVAVQQDGRLVTATRDGANVLLARLLPDGSPDTSFANGGTFAAALGTAAGTYTTVRQLLIQPDQRILLIGQIDHPALLGFGGNLLLARFNSDGTLDASFGNGGVVRTSVGDNEDAPGGAALQPDGRIVVTGSRRDPAILDRHELILLRYQPDGQLDTSFDGDGIVVTTFGRNHAIGHDVAVQADGKVVVAGSVTKPGATSYIYPSSKQALVARFLADGRPDPSFASNGVLISSFESAGGSAAAQLALLPDGRMLVSGYSASSAANDAGTRAFVAQLDATGQLDPQFAGDGVAFPALPSTITDRNAITGMELQPDGRIIASCYRATVECAVRLNPDGSWDTSFGTGGVAWSPYPAGGYAMDIILQPDGKFLLPGAHYNWTAPRGYDFPLLRLLARDADTDGQAEPWDLAPDAMQITGRSASAGTPVTAAPVTIGGLGENVKVPLRISGGEYALNGGSVFTALPGYVGNGDTVTVRYLAGATPSLTVGGMHKSHNRAFVLGPQLTSTFVELPPEPGTTLSVSVVQPTPERLNVPLVERVSALFGSKINPATVTPSSFLLRCNGQPVSATLRVTGEQLAWLQPVGALPANSICEATLTTAIRGQDGKSLAAPYRWHFMTRAANVTSRSGR